MHHSMSRYKLAMRHFVRYKFLKCIWDHSWLPSMSPGRYIPGLPFFAQPGSFEVHLKISGFLLKHPPWHISKLLIRCGINCCKTDWHIMKHVAMSMMRPTSVFKKFLNLNNLILSLQILVLEKSKSPYSPNACQIRDLCMYLE